MNEKAIPIDARFIYNNRMLVFMETAPQSNEYRQLILNERQFEIISRSIYRAHGGVANELVNLHLGNEPFKFPTEIRECTYEK